MGELPDCVDKLKPDELRNFEREFFFRMNNGIM